MDILDQEVPSEFGQEDFLEESRIWVRGTKWNVVVDVFVQQSCATLLNSGSSGNSMTRRRDVQYAAMMGLMKPFVDVK
jgi:hypothetical protein